MVWWSGQINYPQSVGVSTCDIFFERSFFWRWRKCELHNKRFDLSHRWSLLVFLQTRSPFVRKLKRLKSDIRSFLDWVDLVQWWGDHLYWSLVELNQVLYLFALQTNSGYLRKVPINLALIIPPLTKSLNRRSYLLMFGWLRPWAWTSVC